MSKIEKDDVWRTALHKGLQGGTSGAMAMTIQVSSLMWMRTTMNYQYRYGTTTTQAMRHLWKEGGSCTPSLHYYHTKLNKSLV